MSAGHRLASRAWVLLLCLLSAGSVHAQSRFFVGARNLAMGGTGVGGASDAVGHHYNPAGMAYSSGWEFQLPLMTLDVELEGDTLENIDALVALFTDDSLDEIQQRLNDGEATQQDLEKVLDAFLVVLPGLDTTEDGAVARFAAGPAFRWKNWGVSAYYSGAAGVDTTIDLTTGLSLSSGGLDRAIPDPVAPDACDADPVCLAFADELAQETGIDSPRAEVLVSASGDALTNDPEAFDTLVEIVNSTSKGGTTLADNPSEVVRAGIIIGQVAFTYSRLIYREKLSIGATAKIMSGKTFLERTALADIEDVDDSYEEFFEHDASRTDTDFGVDLGLMYRPTGKWSLGFVAQNVNTPEFDLSGIDSAIRLEPLVRVGAAYRPLRWFNLAADIDLTEVEAGVIRNFDYRYANAGAEFLIGNWFAGRVGAYKNLSFDRAETIITAGLGFAFRRFSIDLALAAATNTADLPSGPGTVPKGFAAGLQFNWRPKS